MLGITQQEKKVLARMVGAVMFAEGLIRVVDAYAPQFSPVVYLVIGLVIILAMN